MQFAEQCRPRRFEDVAGQDKAVQDIQRVIARGWGGRAWWLVGDSGTGKTTLAKLIADYGAAELATEEHDSGSLTPAGVREIETATRYKPLGIQGKHGRCVIVNEAHGLAQNTVRALLDTLERIPGHLVWVFTTIGDDDRSAPKDRKALLSRCHRIRLADNEFSRVGLARRAKTLAVAAGVDGFSEAVYLAALDGCGGNMRELLQRVECGQVADEARENLTDRLRKMPLDSHHAAERAALQRLLAEIA